MFRWPSAKTFITKDVLQKYINQCTNVRYQASKRMI